MDRAASEDAFFLAPRGQVLFVPGLAFWCMHERLWGATMTGAVEEAQVAQFIAWADREHERDHGRYLSIFDLRTVHSISIGAFALFGRYVHRSRVRQAGRVERGAVIRPPAGLFAAAIEGALAVLRPFTPWEVVDSLEPALAALGLEDPHGEIDALYQGLGALDGVREELQCLWARDPHQSSREAIARQLGTSVRSLQRKLRAQGTSFEQELRRARVLRAQKLLLETDLKLTTIALESGFSTAAHFSRVFREATGLTPSAWRAQSTGGSPRFDDTSPEDDTRAPE